MTRLALIGAGGKMGCRITDNLKDLDTYDTAYVEVSDTGRANLERRDLSVTPLTEAVGDAAVVVLAVPDVALESVSQEVVGSMQPGSLLLTLDPAAALDDKVHRGPGVAFAIAHPCHPSLFVWEPTEDATRDFYGGVSAAQPIVCALVDGTDEDYALTERVARDLYAPVSRSHRVTLQQMAILEPGLVETLGQTCMEVIKEGFDRVVEQGVPADAARDFLLGHLRIQAAVLFGEVDGTFSDAAYKISQRARPAIFRDDWHRVLELDDIREQVREITTA